MKKQLSFLFVFIILCSLIFIACSKSEGDGVTPTYKSEGTSTGNNPYNGTTT